MSSKKPTPRPRTQRYPHKTPRASKKGLVPAERLQRGIVSAQPAMEAAKAILSPNTLRAYKRDWKDFFQVDSLEHITIKMSVAVTSSDVADFRDACIGRGLGPGTVHRKLSSLRAYFDVLILRGALTLNPAHAKLVHAPKRGQVQKMEALSVPEVEAFLGAIDHSTQIGRRDYAAIMVGLHMGLRRSEAVAIRIDQFRKIDDRVCVVFRSKGEKERIIWINRSLEEALAAYSKDRGQEPGWLFPGKNPKKSLSGDQFWRIVQRYLKKAGIRKQVGTHGLRATFITINLAKGTPLDQIQKTVGHSRGETTLGYARDMEMVKSRAPEAMEGLTGKPKTEQD